MIFVTLVGNSMKPFDLFSILYQELWPTFFSKSMSEGVLDFLTFLTEECVNAFFFKRRNAVCIYARWKSGIGAVELRSAKFVFSSLV
jgi:hypothetical protein